MTQSTPTRSDSLTIPPPREDRPPLRANIFSCMQKGNTQLIPLFPHFYPGAMVPAGAILRGGEDKDYGHFFHHNTVDEVVLAFATKGSLLKTGQMFVGGRIHGVNSFLKNEKDPESFAIMCITQRQSEDKPQSESVSIQCKQCREEIYRFNFDATPPPDVDELSHPFPTVALLPELFESFNNDPALRICAACGHENEPFPLKDWGWEVYADQAATVQNGLYELNAVTESSNAP